MCKKIFPTVVLIIALLIAIAASMIKPDSSYLNSVIAIARFFDVMLPILAVGALVKYLCNR